MADTKVTALAEYDAYPAVDDLLYFVDVSDKSDDQGGTNFKIKAQRLAVTDGNIVYVTGGGAIILGGFTLTAQATGTIIDKHTAQTMSAKTFTTPTIADLTNMGHDHTDAAGGGTGLHFFDCIPIFSGGGGSYILTDEDTDYDTDHEAGTSFWINKTNLGASCTFKWHAYLHRVSGTVKAELYNATAAAAVAGSELTSTWAVPELNSSGDLYAALAAGLNRYYIRLKGTEAVGNYVTRAVGVIDF